MWSHIFKDWKVENHHLHLLDQDLSDGEFLLHDNGDTLGAGTGSRSDVQDLENSLKSVKKITQNSFSWRK